MGNDPETSTCLPPYIQQLATTISSSDVYAVLSVAAATLAVGLNLIQAIVVVLFACSWKSAYYIALCFCGLLSAVALVWHVVAIRLPHTEGCGAIPSALSIAVLVGYTAHMTAPIIHHCIADTWPRAFASHSRNRGICVLLNGFAWCETALLAAAVLSDWPSAPVTTEEATAFSSIVTVPTREDACALPRFWSSTFSVFVSVLYFLHVLLDLVILADMTLSNKNSATPYLECESIYEYRARNDLRQLWTKFFLLMLGTSPFVATMLYQAAGPFGAHCALFKELLPVWTLIISVMLSVALPLVHVFNDEVVAGGSIMVLRRMLCCTCSSRRSRVGPQPDQILCHQRF